MNCMQLIVFTAKLRRVALSEFKKSNPLLSEILMNFEQELALCDASRCMAGSELGGWDRVKMVNFRSPRFVINGFVLSNSLRCVKHHTGVSLLGRRALIGEV